MTVRNEDPARAFLRLRAVKASLDATGEGAAFAYFVLSDSDDPAVAAAEEAAVAAWKAEGGEGEGAAIVYRRRALNAGFKAGNVRDF
jgi:membrane glycosyltransferase